MPFVNPAFLGLGLLIGVPIIIYLINRQMYQRRPWAAMEFLLRALRKRQRGIQLQNLLLLLIRISIILLLVLAVARPIARHTALGTASEGPQNWILAVDTSYSMGYRGSDRSLFDEARDTLIDMVELRPVEGESGGLLRSQDKVALLTMGFEPREIVKVSELKNNRSALLDELRTLKVSARGMRLVPSLRVIEAVAESFTDSGGTPEPCRVVMFSDLQRKDWLADDQPRAPEAREILERLRDRGVQFAVSTLSGLSDPGASLQRSNVAVTGLEVKPDLVAVDVPVEIRVTVRNFGDRAAEGLDLSLRVDPPWDEEGESQLGEIIRIGAGDSEARTLPYSFSTPGFHTVVAEVRSDDLVVDNRRYLVVLVHEEVDVLLVDGDPSVDPLKRETVFVEYALEPTDDALGAPGERVTPFRPHYLGAEQLREVNWDEYRVVVLANVTELPKAELESLERYVNEGGALVVFLGENARPDYYNEHFHRGGKGLLPWRMGDTRGSDAVPVYLQFVDDNHPVASFFATHKDKSYLYTGIVPFYRYVQVYPPSVEPADGKAAPPTPSPVRVLCRYSDLDRSPAVLDGPFGRGRVLWFTSTADQEWNEFSVFHDFVVFIHESFSYLVGFGEKTNNLNVGDVFERVYDLPYDVTLRAPAGEPLTRPTNPKDFRYTHSDTALPGLYRLELQRHQSQQPDQVESFAINVETEESDLRGMIPDDLETHFGVEPTFFEAAQLIEEARQQDAFRGYEFWRWCLYGLLLLLVLETILAQLFGRGTK